MRGSSVAIAAALFACTSEPAPPPDIESLPPPPIHTPRWAFRPWISKDISTAADTRDFVRGFEERGIPVGVVVLDSPWETHYNSFIPNPSRYPDFGGLVAELRAKDVRTVLWVTQMTNDTSFDVEIGGDTYEGPSPNYFPGKSARYYVNDGEVYFWWKGTGSAVDFNNPDARRWWHAQQKPLLDLGVAGWKLDFGESYITTEPIRTKTGPISLQEYSESYYRDFYTYGANLRGTEEFVTMVRPYDASYQFPGRFFAKKEHAPVAWVGDNRRDWFGFEDALDHLFRSAAAGYVVIGSDIGGYLDRDDQNLTGPVIPFDAEVFARWTAVGALNPFMQLHGRANLTPWTVPERADEIVRAYRYWSVLHEALIPFWYSLAEEAYAGRQPQIMRPIGELASWAGDYRYTLGDALLVAPLLDGTGVRSVELPAGSRWYDWWDASGAPLSGTVTASMARDLTQIPLYVREGAIVPLEVGSSTVAELGAPGPLLLVYPGDGARGEFVTHDLDEATTNVTLDGLSLSLSRVAAATRVRARSTPPITGATSGGAALSVRQDGAYAWIELPASASAVRVDFTR